MFCQTVFGAAKPNPPRRTRGQVILLLFILSPFPVSERRAEGPGYHDRQSSRERGPPFSEFLVSTSQPGVPHVSRFENVGTETLRKRSPPTAPRAMRLAHPSASRFCSRLPFPFPLD
jgi:hypothetical protein